MALIKCRECGKEVSTNAAACQNCGNKLPKRTSVARWIVGGLFLFFVVTCALNVQKYKDAEEARIAALTPEQKAAKAESAEFDSSKYACEVLIKKTLHDPDSAEFDPADSFPARRLGPHSYLVQVKLRAKNAFNALRYTSMNCTVSLENGNWIAHSIEQIR